MSVTILSNGYSDAIITLTKLIAKSGCDGNLVIEFHEFYNDDNITKDKEYWQNSRERGLQSFNTRNQHLYDIFVNSFEVDTFPARISHAVKIGNEWYVALNGGANYYGGGGPHATFEMREFCKKKNLNMICLSDKLESWLDMHSNNTYKESSNFSHINIFQEYEKINKIIEKTGKNIQSTLMTYKSMEEEDIRNIFLTSLITHDSQATGESFNKKGKTDITINTSLGKLIYEFKIWHGAKKAEEGINQLFNNYVSIQDKFNGMVFINKTVQHTYVMNEIKKIFEAHPQYKETVTNEDNFYDFIFRNSDDSEIASKLRVFVFSISTNK